MRIEFAKLGPKIWVSSIDRNCLAVSVLNSTLFRPSGDEYGVRSNIYVPKRLSLSEKWWSMRVVKKFSLTICWPAKVYSPRSPFARLGLLGSGKCQKVRYLAAFGSTATDPVERFPARALTEGTVATVVIPLDCRIAS